MKNNFAWVVSLDVEDPQDANACVVFAQDEESSILLGWPRLGGEGPECCSTSRAPEFDDWAQAGEVPNRVLLEHGWSFECRHCGTIMDSCEGVVEVGRLLYCSEECRVGEAAEIAEVNRAFEGFQARARELFPNVTFFEFQGGWPILTPVGRFTFPGSLYGGGRVRMKQNGELELSVASGDLARWEQWSSQQASADSL